MPNPGKPRHRGTRRRRWGGLDAQTTSRRCEKLRYTTEAAAETAARLKAETDERYPDQLRSYFCHRCRGFHLTSQPKRDPAP